MDSNTDRSRTTSDGAQARVRSGARTASGSRNVLALVPGAAGCVVASGFVGDLGEPLRHLVLRGTLLLSTSALLWFVWTAFWRDKRNARDPGSPDEWALAEATRYRVLLEEASDAIVVFDATLRVQMTNARASELLGMARRR